MIVVRRVDNTDPLVQLALREMDKECFDAKKDASPSVETGTWWVAYDGKAPAGYCCLRESQSQPGWGYMSRAGVVEKYRGRGLQKRMIKTRLTHAKKLKMKGVVSDTAKYNVASSNSLIACGFKLYRPEWPWSFESALYWRVPLTPSR